MVGYPGAGKTTMAQYIHELTGAVHIWADHERQQMFGHQGQSSNESKQLYLKLNQQVAALLQSGKSVIFDTNFRFRKDRDALREIAKEAGATVKIIWMTTDKETARKRATEMADDAPSRFFGNIPPDDFERVTSFFQEPTEDEAPLCFDGKTATKDDVARLLGITQA